LPTSGAGETSALLSLPLPLGTFRQEFVPFFVAEGNPETLCHLSSCSLR
jgi:hypothetical protein